MPAPPTVPVQAVADYLAALRASLPPPASREDVHRAESLDALLTRGVDERQLVTEAACMRLHICPAGVTA